MIDAVLIDVGGTLWSERSWRAIVEDRARIVGERLAAAFPSLDAGDIAALVALLEERVTGLDGQLEADIWAVVRGALGDLSLALDPEEVRHVVTIPADGRIGVLPGARELLERTRALGLTNVILSNAIWRAERDYREDFAAQGLLDRIDAIVSSVDTLYRKPDPRIFRHALALAGDPDPGSCVMIGNREDKDVAPARTLGMRTILVAIENPPPERSDADAMVTSLRGAADLIQAWAK